MVLRATHAGPADLLSLHRRRPDDYPFLLQSVAGHPQSGRYDILFAFPAAFLAERDGVLAAEGAPRAGDFFASLSAWVRETGAEAPLDLPFVGGWFVLLGYEAARRIERRLSLPASPFTLPDMLAVR